MRKAIILLLASTMVFAAEPVNLIINGNFTKGSENWFTYANDSGRCSLRITDSGASVDILQAGNFAWSAALAQGGITLEKGSVYRLSFTASAAETKRIIVTVANPEEPYNSYSGIHKVNIAGEPKRFSFDFTMRRAGCANASLAFQCGGGKGTTILFKDVALVKSGTAPEQKLPAEFPKPFAASIMRGINLGNTLDAPNESDWGPELCEEYFDIIKDSRRFDHIRIPCRWETHTAGAPGYTIDPEWMRRVDWAVSCALSRGFYVVLNMHHNTNFQDNPAAESARFLAMWRQIAEHFRDYPPNLYFEIYNEPGSHKDSKWGTLDDPEIWNRIWPQAYRVIRETNKTRTIIITGPKWGSPDTFTQLKIPDDIAADPNIMAAVHFYYPADFCFQGSSGNGFDSTPLVRWRGSEAEKKAITERLDKISTWCKNKNIRLWNSEFSCFDTKALREERLNWAEFVRAECEKRGIAWAYWDFSGDLSSLYNVTEHKWEDEELLNALSPLSRNGSAAK